MQIDFSKKGLIAYVTAGFPSMEFTQKAILTLQAAGVSAIEVGVPYSDPVADGPTIALASHKALERGINLDRIFEGLQAIKDKVTVPLYLMSYYSPLFTYGEDRVLEQCNKCGVSGIIFPDLQLDEGLDTFTKCKEKGIDPILLLFPNADDKRIGAVAEASGSFIYYVNLFGTTGVRDSIPASSLKSLEHLKTVTGKPVYAGFGVSKREMFSQISEYSDGVIIGSAIIKRMLEHEQDESRALAEISTFIKGILGD